jgi:hypothetical protein
VLVVDGRGGTSEIVDLIYLNVERKCHVMTQKFEAGIQMEMLQISFGAGEQVVNTYYVMPLPEQAIDKMGSEEASASRYEDAFAAVIKTRHESNSW